MRDLVSRRGLDAYVADLPGFYVVNERTNICVAGYATEAEATGHIAALDEKYPDDYGGLKVVEVRRAS
jgi:hypothetical protein